MHTDTSRILVDQRTLQPTLYYSSYCSRCEFVGHSIAAVHRTDNTNRQKFIFSQLLYRAFVAHSPYRGLNHCSSFTLLHPFLMYCRGRRRGLVNTSRIASAFTPAACSFFFWSWTSRLFGRQYSLFAPISNPCR